MTSSNRSAAHFNRVASFYGRLRGQWPLSVLRRQETRAVRRLVDVRRGDLVLDAGCGVGETMVWLRGRGARVVGIDTACAMAARCRAVGLWVSVQDLERPAVRPCFDWVLCLGALEFTRDPRAAVGTLASCLKPDGRLALLFPRRGVRGLLYYLYHRAHGVRIHLFSVDEVQRWLAAVGLSPRAARHCWLSTVVVGAVREARPSADSRAVA